MKILSIIQCSKVKQSYKCPALAMYSKSKLFTKCVSIATRLKSEIYVLSSYYGLLPPTTIISPYEYGLQPSPYTKKLTREESLAQRKNRNTHNKKVAAHLVKKLIQQKDNIDFTQYDLVIVFANYNYRKCLEKANLVGDNFDFWFKGSLGLFDLQNTYLDKKCDIFISNNL